ncbi:pyridoxamine 5'-phosphate oxidase family protein [uncultured Cetobacterium sp.]|uniref:pyridoxamine 5'-phosphate oxidase family protein n=1 Tax=uncultured Cetobacterium sp. TaxID=527638 RepID=UPI00260CFD18|nr:pyridoxamine 5'-phosphate oxidase family protein [uncultured Cetobacterium sp.]
MMKNRRNFNPEDIKLEIEEFKNKNKNIILGTISKDNEINVTNAIYLNCDGQDYMFISEIGDHYQNLKNRNQDFEVMFIQDENEATNPLARKRLRYKTDAEFLARDETFNLVLDRFEEKLGDVIKVVRKMEDFHLVKLNFKDGRFVKGFGQAYILKGIDIFQMTGDKK